MATSNLGQGWGGHGHKPSLINMRQIGYWFLGQGWGWSFFFFGKWFWLGWAYNGFYKLQYQSLMDGPNWWGNNQNPFWLPLAWWNKIIDAFNSYSQDSNLKSCLDGCICFVSSGLDSGISPYPLKFVVKVTIFIS